MILEQGAGRRLRAPPAAGPRACAARCAPGACRSSAPMTAGVFAGAHRRDHAGRRGCDALRKLIHERFDLAGHRPRQGEGPHVPHRPPRRQQRPDADGHAGQASRWASSSPASNSPAAACRRRWSTSPRTRAQPRRGLNAARDQQRQETSPMQRRSILIQAGAAATTLARAARSSPGRAGRSASSSASPGGGTDALARVVATKLTQMWKPAGHRREQGRRGRRAGGRLRRQQAERWQHAADGAHQQPRARAQPAAQAELQRRARLRAHRAGRRHAQPADRQPNEAARTVKDLVALCKAETRPGDFRSARLATGSAQHLALEMFAAGQGRRDPRPQGQRGRCSPT